MALLIFLQPVENILVYGRNCHRDGGRVGLILRRRNIGPWRRMPKEIGDALQSPMRIIDRPGDNFGAVGNGKRKRRVQRDLRENLDTVRPNGDGGQRTSARSSDGIGSDVREIAAVI